MDDTAALGFKSMESATNLDSPQDFRQGPVPQRSWQGPPSKAAQGKGSEDKVSMHSEMTAIMVG